MRKLLISVVALMCLAGCRSVDLAAEWAPLETLQQNPALVQGTGMTTIGNTVYVRNLSDWLGSHPEPFFTAMLRHERAHARRQLAYPGGVWSWIARYGSDPEFMWAEEQLGFYEQINWYRRSGISINVDGLATLLAGYSGLGGPMVTRAAAKQWVIDVTRGRWSPPSE